MGKRDYEPGLKVFLWALPVVLWGGAAVAQCMPGAVDVRGSFGEARFRVDVADEPDERALGLMNVESMPSGKGMLFLYDDPQAVSFWMRNTFIPLDMVFLDQTGTVVNIHENARPLDETPIPGGSDDVLAVLEINGGLAARIGLDEGDELRHPQLPQGVAAWPCSAQTND